MTVIESASTINWTPDDWQTPNEIARLMTQLVIPSDSFILEPAAGTGQIAKYIPHPESRNILCLDINEQRVNLGQHNAPDCNWLVADFLRDEIEPATLFDLIITNPPFSKCVEYIERSLELLNPDNPEARLIFLLPLDWNCSKARGAHWQRLNAHIHKEYRIMGRVAFLDAEGVPRSRRQCCDAVFEIRPGRVDSGVSYLGS
ncbi:methyltransferase [Komarekiella sp. 'clone 1']|uniref:Methyltransferase n=1 Tax=Komarekiella delphini-convector SJRDD-AB1 TaxID=2593771 RepID=A0AA40T3P5_9NOST|nr:N-6 DNA methylase [Komarekiella delphini-convector]MBD6620017.1 methyltransferase [Komarekiella delphini-convector SJRDD-AB1]